MNKNLQHIQRTLRDTGLLVPVEKARYWASLAKWYRRNRAFCAKHPDFSLPPKILAYDAYSAPDWEFYKKSGEETAAFLADLVDRYVHDASPLRILEWGCGPARVIRHLPPLLARSSRICGCDYNSASILWCEDNIPGIEFFRNSLRPPLAFDAESFDLIYAISVFTHLSEAIGRDWGAELLRIARPGGVVIATTHGDSILRMLLPDEVASYRESGIVVRDKIEEGKKMFMACHSPSYVRDRLFASFDLLEHVAAGFPHTGQDLWVFRRAQ